MRVSWDVKWGSLLRSLEIGQNFQQPLGCYAPSSGIQMPAVGRVLQSEPVDNFISSVEVRTGSIAACRLYLCKIKDWLLFVSASKEGIEVIPLAVVTLLRIPAKNALKPSLRRRLNCG